MLTVLALLFTVGYAKNCQWVYETLSVIQYPVGTNRCNYAVVDNVEYSYIYECTSSTTIKLSRYSTPDCTGDAKVDDDYQAAAYECDQDYESCGKTFGFKTPCSCTAANHDCTSAAAVALVDQMCVYDDDSSYEWEIKCGSIDDAYAKQITYSEEKCQGNTESRTFHAGCTEDDDGDEIDWIVCPANKATFSFVALVVALIACML